MRVLYALSVAMSSVFRFVHFNKRDIIKLFNIIMSNGRLVIQVLEVVALNGRRTKCA